MKIDLTKMEVKTIESSLMFYKMYDIDSEEDGDIIRAIIRKLEMAKRKEEVTE